MSKKIKIAQIGAGHDHATAAIKTLSLQNDIYDLVGYAVVPEDYDNLPRFAYEGNKTIYEGIPKMTVEEILNYPDLDAVCIETEDRALTKYAQMAADKGLNIQMDKPGGIDSKAFDKLIDTVKEKKLVFHTGYMYRYNPEVISIMDKIKNGDLGEIYAVEAQMNCYHESDKRRWLGNYPGGMLYYLGSHLIDLVYSIMGKPNEIIPLSTHTLEDTAEDFGMAIFKYDKGVSFVKSTAVEMGGFERRQLVICGTKGTIEVRPFEWLGGVLPGVFSPQTTKVREVFSRDWHKPGDTHTSVIHGRYDALYRAFASYVNGEKENPYTYEYERELHKIILKSCGADN